MGTHVSFLFIAPPLLNLIIELCPKAATTASYIIRAEKVCFGKKKEKAFEQSFYLTFYKALISVLRTGK